MLNIYDFLNIYVLLYSNFRLIKISYEDYKLIFNDSINNINRSLEGKCSLNVENNDFHIEWLSDNKDRELDFLFSILNSDNYSIEKILEINDNKNFNFKDDINRLFVLLKETYYEQGYDYYKEVSYYKDKSFLIYNTLNSILKTFIGDKNLLESSKYITSLINKYNISAFYLFRIRNMFLYFYQSVVGRKDFYFHIINNKDKILNSKYLKLVFSDVEKARLLNKSNPIVDLFEGMVLLQCLNGRGIPLLNNIREKIPKGHDGGNISFFISNYYIDKGLYKEAEYELSLLKENKGFKYYRKLFPIYILSNQKNKLINEINYLLESRQYELCFYIKGEECKLVNSISFNSFLESNENLNLPLDIELNIFLSIIEKYNSVGLKIINDLFGYIKKDHRDFFLRNDDISIILKKI